MSKLQTTDEIRKKWLDFFQQKGYHFIEPTSLIPQDDFSLLWINSGVAALKRYFNSSSLPPAKNMVNCQRVIRTDDLANINQDSYHQTLFEMLGVFSIGGNFKSETIPYFWEFFTSSKWLNLNPKKLFITVYEDDVLTYRIWKKQTSIIPGHILYGSKKTNFWDMGDGPCGPNTEIYYDFNTEGARPRNVNDLDNKRFIEICNIVFSEFYHKGDEYLPLKEKCVDVGGGLERTAMILQNKENTFQIDLWENVITLIGQTYKENNPNFDNEPKGNYYIIADHLRTAIFALADGAIFESKGRGYILKKLVKRAILLSYFLNFSEVNILLFVEQLINSNSLFYSHLKLKQKSITQDLKKEIDYIMQFIKSKLKQLDKYCQSMPNTLVPTKVIFLWYDTHGIPLELIRHYLNQKDYSFSEKEFGELLARQKQVSRKDREKKVIKTFSGQ